MAKSKKVAVSVQRVAAVGGATVDLASRLRELRQLKRWSLEALAEQTGLARSTLSKIENKQMSPTLDVLQKLAAGFGIDVCALLKKSTAPALARRSITRAGQGRRPYTIPTYEHEFLCSELSQTRFTPIRTRVLARSRAEFPEWYRHPGEDCVLVLDGEVEFLSEFYEPVRLATGDCVHYDSTMGHAFISVSKKDAVVFWVTAA
jgi:transcriptional regulator with XRE-family HTH domain